MRNGAYLYRYAPFTVLRLSIKSPAVTALPKGEPGGCSPCWHEKRSVSMPIRSIRCFTTVHQVARGDSSPKGRAKGGAPLRNGAYLYRYAPFTVLRLSIKFPAVTALPKGEPRGCAPCWHEKWSVSILIRSIHCFTTAHQISRGCRDFFIPRPPLFCREAAFAASRGRRRSGRQ